MKARSLFPSENDSEGRSGTGDSRGMPLVNTTTYDKVRSKVLTKKNSNSNSAKSNNSRTPSYSGSAINYKKTQRLKEDHSNAVSSSDQFKKRRKTKAPEFNYTPPRGPSQGR